MQLQITDTRTLTDERPDVRNMEFNNTAVTIGGHSANTVQLPDTEVAAYHGMILPLGEEHWTYRSTDPQAQTLINGEPVAQEQVDLEDGDVIEVGRFTLKLSLDSVPELVLPEARNLEELARIKDFPLPPRSEVRRPEADVSLSASRRAALVGFDANLRQAVDLPQVMEHTLDLLLPELGARTAWVGIRHGNTGPIEHLVGRNVNGSYSGEPHLWETFQYRCLSRYQYVSIPRTGQKDTQSMLAVPLMSTRGALGLIVADTRKHRRVFDEADLDFATMVADFVASQVSMLLEEREVQQGRTSASQLALLREVQTSFETESLPQWPQFQVAAFARPGTETAGNLHDVARLPNGLASAMVGHVEAETIRAARALAEVRSAYRIACMHADPPQVQLRALNYLLFDEVSRCNLHVAVTVTNPKTGATEYATAGSIGVIIIDARGNPRLLTMKDTPAIGKVKGYEYAGASERIKEGETLAFFTRGCARVRNASGEKLGEERFIATLCDGFGQPASAALADLLADLEPFLKNGTPPDDITVLLAHHKAAPA